MFTRTSTPPNSGFGKIEEGSDLGLFPPHRQGTENAARPPSRFDPRHSCVPAGLVNVGDNDETPSRRPGRRPWRGRFASCSEPVTRVRLHRRVHGTPLGEGTSFFFRVAAIPPEPPRRSRQYGSKAKAESEFRWEGETRGESGRLTASARISPSGCQDPLYVGATPKSNPKLLLRCRQWAFSVRIRRPYNTVPFRSGCALSRICVQDYRPNAGLRESGRPATEKGLVRSQLSIQTLRGRTSMHQFSVCVFSRLPPLRCELRSGWTEADCSARLPRVSFKHHFGALMTHADPVQKVQPRTGGHRRPLDLDHFAIRQGLVPRCP